MKLSSVTSGPVRASAGVLGEGRTRAVLTVNINRGRGQAPPQRIRCCDYKTAALPIELRRHLSRRLAQAFSI